MINNIDFVLKPEEELDEEQKINNHIIHRQMQFATEQRITTKT